MDIRYIGQNDKRFLKMSNLQQLFNQTQENYELVPEFMEKLLASDIYCLGTEDANNKIQFRLLESPDGAQAIPFFLELETVYRDIGADVEYVSLNAKKFFEMTQGAILVLNPTSELSKEFQPEEITVILGIENDKAI